MQNRTNSQGKLKEPRKISREQIAKMNEARKEVKVENNLLKKFYRRPTHLNAIKAMCFECVGGTPEKLPDGGWKEMIRNCGADGMNGHECPLYRYRPYRMRGE